MDLDMVFDKGWEQDDESLEDIFGDIIGGVAKLATAPIDLVAKTLPKPMKKAAENVMQGKSPFASAPSKAAKKVALQRKKKKTSSTAGPVTDQRLMETMVKMLGAQNIAKIAGKTPKVRMKSTSKKTPHVDQAMVSAVKKAVVGSLGPNLSSINKKLKLAELQRIATSEHNAINNTAAFRRKVLKDLVNLSTTLPANDPTRERIRRFGIMSGIL